jgi:hypothetical protein
MPDLYDERRQEPRFRTSGEAVFEVQGRTYRGDILDLSLNGLKVARPPEFALGDGARFKLSLQIPNSDPFVAEVLLVHAEGAHLGLEFYDMPPRDFGVLAGLIEQYAQWRRRAASSG